MSQRISLRASLERIKAGTIGGFTTAQTAEWIQTHLRLNGRRVSFKGREYQERILKSAAPTIVVKKCSQVGISELMLMRNLALMDIIDGFKIIHTLPTAVFAQRVMKTRVDPLIQGSEYVQGRVNKNLDNASVKQMGNSLLYLGGTNTDTAVISTPADSIVIDELDFSVIENVEKLQSRLTASAYRWWSYVSTPTTPKFGIDAQFASTKRYFNYCRCTHCSEWYLPDYLQHVRIPEYGGNLLDITAKDLSNLRWREAALFCPHCGKPADLSLANRAWVCENPDDLGFEGEGFQINPTDAPEIISMPDLVLWSTRFNRKVNFVNYHLGQTMEDEDSGINDRDLDTMFTVGQQPLRGFKVFGLDMGTVCHLVVGVTDGQGRLTVTHLYPIHYTELETELDHLIKIHRPTTIVADSQPYVETVHRLQQKIYNLYGSVYITSRNLEAFRLIEKEEDKSRALLEVRQVNVNRNFALNNLMMDIRHGNIGVVSQPEWETMKAHLKDMKRRPESTSAFTGDGNAEEADSYVWVKTSGNDHYHHALLYCHVASQLVHHLPSSTGRLPSFIGSFKLRT
ncbi:phage terminase large subunit family protein [Neisseria leonii]|uniref:Phage terminase large subunit family protein n=1 Tax=Neisseria leonii TaxID=2995413 RepID=A0A9X4E0V1_9NEIS|nr:phage terminase large subunit family protein [Neisseria sp. 51.81]MDD9326734.1 phage terminase large subunit family protein [Neisseria sp. 51.81]